jgi:Tfp pilus assembly protein PilO
MTGRDRIVIVGIAVLAVLAAGWLLLVSPERQKAAQAQSQVETASQKLQSAQAQVASARTAQTSYSSAYASVVRLGKAVPPQQEVPSLIYELEQASNQRSIDFNSITTSSTGSSSASSSTAAAATTAGFSQMPFTFIFKGSFFGLAHLLHQIDGLARITSTSAGGTAAASDTGAPVPGGVQVSGRLLTIQGVNLALENQSSAGLHSAGSSSSGPSGMLTATITATAYVLPAGESLTGGATAAGPVASSAAQAASHAASSSSPTSPAVIQGAP